MKRAGDEMALTLQSLLTKMDGGLDKTAAKKKDDEDKKEDKKDEAKKNEDKKDEDKAEKKDEKKGDKKKDKKAAVMASVVQTLVKLADDLDVAGADNASTLVDEALRVIVQKMDEDAQKKKIAQFDDDEDVTEFMEQDEPVTGDEEGQGPMDDRELEAPFGEPTMSGGSDMADLLEGLSEEEKAELKALLG